jgi:hypothetical protein
MKYALALLAVAFSSPAFSQTLKVNAGPNVCRLETAPDTFRIGGNPVVVAGTGPFTYQWTLLNGASPAQFIDSPGIARPKLVGFPSTVPADSVDLIVKAFNSTSVGTDTVRIYYAKLFCTTASCGGTKAAGDTLRLFNPCTTQGFAPIKYRWQPGEYITDTTVAEPKTWTPISRIYAGVFTDRAGCVWRSDCLITVTSTPPPSGVPSVGNNNEVLIVPSPVTAASVVRLPGSAVGSTYRIIAADGRILRSGIVTDLSLSLGETASWPAGVYTFHLLQNGANASATRFEVR